LFFAEEPDVLLAHAPVHDHLKAGFSGRGGGFCVFNAFLHPDRFSPDFYRLLNDGRNVFRFPENINDVYFPGDRRKVRVALMPQDLLFVGVDGHDSVAVLLKVPADYVAGAFGIGGKPHYRHRPAVFENVLDSSHRYALYYILARLTDKQLYPGRSGQRVELAGKRRPVVAGALGSLDLTGASGIERKE
jgi:hypothetical protein